MSTTDMTTARMAIAPREEYVELFPLPLAPFELFLLQDERPGYPMTFCVELVFLGRMNRPALIQSVAEAAARHPLLFARLRPTGGRLQWVLEPDPSVSIDWQDPGAPYAPPRGAAIDLRRESGLRIWVREDAERTSVTCQFHHACCDGEGSRHFGHDVMTAYTRLIGGEEPLDWTRVEYDRLRQRAVFQPPAAESGPTTTTTWQKLRDAYHFHVLGPSPLAVRGGGAGEPQSGRPLTIKHLFDRDETLRIEERAAGSERTLNDVAIALLFRTLADWNRRHGRAPGRQRLRLLMPTDLRERGDRWLTATNRISFSFLTRTIDQCAEWQALVEGISQETQYIKRIRLGLDFVNIMAGVQKIPGLFPALLRLPRCMATAVLTNLGDTTRRFRRRFAIHEGYPVIGDVLLEQVVGAPPLRPGTLAGFGICTCAGRIALSLRSDQRRMDDASSRALLENYVEAWRVWSAGR